MQTRRRTRRTPTFGARVLAAVLTAVLTAGALLAGCGGNDDGGGETTGTSTQSPTTPTDSAVPTESASPSQSAPSESATESAAGVQQITVTIASGEVTPPPDRIEVDEGRVVRIVVTSDEADEIHVHGYDLSSDVEAGAAVTIEFTADMTGLFEVESHHLDAVLFHLQIQ